MDRHERLRELYRAFNDRDIDAVLASLTADVDWPNAWEGGRVLGPDGVRAYWTRQWEAIDPTVEPLAMTTEAGDTVAVEVHATVRGLDGAVIDERRVVHRYAFRGDLVARMDVAEPPPS